MYLLIMDNRVMSHHGEVRIRLIRGKFADTASAGGWPLDQRMRKMVSIQSYALGLGNWAFEGVVTK